MICIEERGGKPEQAGPVEPRCRVDPVSARPFALRFRLGAPFARVDRVSGVSRRFDIAVALVAAAYADLERDNRIYFTRQPLSLLVSLSPLLSLSSSRSFLSFFYRSRNLPRERDKIRYFAPAACPRECNRPTLAHIPRCWRNSCSPGRKGSEDSA